MVKKKKIKQAYQGWAIHFDDEQEKWIAEHDNSEAILINECRITLVDNIDAFNGKNT